jgi:hypothetical protein
LLIFTIENAVIPQSGGVRKASGIGPLACKSLPVLNLLLLVLQGIQLVIPAVLLQKLLIL